MDGSMLDNAMSVHKIRLLVMLGSLFGAVAALTGEITS